MKILDRLEELEKSAVQSSWKWNHTWPEPLDGDDTEELSKALADLEALDK